MKIKYYIIEILVVFIILTTIWGLYKVIKKFYVNEDHINANDLNYNKDKDDLITRKNIEKTIPHINSVCETIIKSLKDNIMALDETTKQLSNIGKKIDNSDGDNVVDNASNRIYNDKFVNDAIDDQVHDTKETDIVESLNPQNISRGISNCKSENKIDNINIKDVANNVNDSLNRAIEKKCIYEDITSSDGSEDISGLENKRDLDEFYDYEAKKPAYLPPDIKKFILSLCRKTKFTKNEIALKKSKENLIKCLLGKVKKELYENYPQYRSIFEPLGDSLDENIYKLIENDLYTREIDGSDSMNAYNSILNSEGYFKTRYNAVYRVLTYFFTYLWRNDEESEN